MKRITFHVYETLGHHIDEAVREWGFLSRADFFRFAALDFILRYKGMVPPKKVMEDFSKTIQDMQARRRASVTAIE